VPEIQSRQFTITSGRDARAESSAARLARLHSLECSDWSKDPVWYCVQITPDNRDICRERALLSVKLGEPALLAASRFLDRAVTFASPLCRDVRQTRSRKQQIFFRLGNPEKIPLKRLPYRFPREPSRSAPFSASS